MASYFNKLSAPSLSSTPSTLSLSMFFHANPTVTHKFYHSFRMIFRTKSSEKSKNSPAAPNRPTDYNNKETYEHPFIRFSRLLKDKAEKMHFNSAKESLKCDLKQELKNVNPKNPTVESGHRAAALVDLAKLLHAETAPDLDDAGSRARQGAMLMDLGETLVDEGKSMVEDALQNISDSK